MKFTRFGRTGLTVSRLCLGTGTFGTQADERVAHQILDKAAGAGVNFIDTADIYPMGPDRSVVGRAEKIVGRWLQGKRDQFIIATKAGGPMGAAPWQHGGSRKHLLDAIDESLKRLGTDYVDLYQLHFDDPDTPLDETLEALDAIVRAGKARYIGVSNFLAYRLARAIGRAESLHLTRLASVQNRYSLLFRQIEHELLPLAREEGIAVTPFNPLAGGLLSGKYRFGDKPTEGRFSTELGQQFRDLYHERYWHQQQFESVEHMKTLAGEIGEPLPKLAIAWVLANPTITSAILGASRPDQLTDTLAAVDLEVPAELKARLDEITDQYRGG
ncbi:MAG TPA: aldo/keto reductase [Candidatus Acidoferrum sp.]|nr:aldo/keto reductase [Candidatus Acidoferrum sp.]